MEPSKLNVYPKGSTKLTIWLGIPTFFNFSMAIGNAASDAAVEKANTIGSFNTLPSLNKFTFVKKEAIAMIRIKNNAKPPYKVNTNFINGTSIPKPKLPTVYAMAPKIPIGDTYMT